MAALNGPSSELPVLAPNIKLDTSDANETSSRNSGLAHPDRPSVPTMRRLSSRRDAIGLMAKAIQATEAERSAFLLPGHKEQAMRPGVRPRSSSCYRARLSISHEDIGAVQPVTPNMPRAHSDNYLTPEFNIASFSEAGSSSGRQRLLSVAVDPMEPRADIPRPPPSAIVSRKSIAQVSDAVDEPIGAWGRYPSHTRLHRACSAGAADQVIAKDFATTDVTILASRAGEEAIQGVKRQASEKRRGRLSSGASKFGKGRDVLKHYGRFFRTPSVEYLRYGHGHRSSVSAGGKLENPDLELLPPIWASRPVSNKGPDKRKDSASGH